MRRTAFAVALACLLAHGCGAATSPRPTGGAAERVVVGHVIDGDTFTTADDERVRLLQIDAPELRQAECHGEQARADLEDLLDGATVELRRDPDLDARDRFGRLLRYVQADGEFVNLALVERGAAAPYFYRGERGRHAGRLLRAARTARRTRLGAWGRCRGAHLDPTRAWQTGTAADAGAG